jgi:O-antigen ligase
MLLIVALHLGGGRHRAVAVAVFAAIALGAYLTINRLPAGTMRRYVTIPAELSQGKMAERRAIWQVASDLFRARPLSGWGSGAFLEAAGSHSGVQSVAHNTYLSVATEQGLPGLVLFVGILVRLVQGARAAGNPTVRLWVPMLAAWGIGAGGLTWECAKATWFMFGIFASHSPADA